MLLQNLYLLLESFISCLYSFVFQNLEEKERKALLMRDQLERENRLLRRRLDHLHQVNNHSLYRVRQERSISECSTSTNSSSSSLSSTSSIKSEESGEKIFKNS